MCDFWFALCLYISVSRVLFYHIRVDVVGVAVCCVYLSFLLNLTVYAAVRLPYYCSSCAVKTLYLLLACTAKVNWCHLWLSIWCWQRSKNSFIHPRIDLPPSQLCNFFSFAVDLFLLPSPKICVSLYRSFGAPFAHRKTLTPLSIRNSHAYLSIALHSMHTFVYVVAAATATAYDDDGDSDDAKNDT